MAESQTEKATRQAVFASISAAAAWGLGMNAIAGWHDETMVSYRLIEALCAAIVVLSSIWWWRSDGTKAVFRMIVLLAAGIGLDVHVQAMSRSLWLAGKIAEFDEFRTSQLWVFRQAGEIIALIYLLAVIVSRMTDRKGHYVP